MAKTQTVKSNQRISNETLRKWAEEGWNLQLRGLHGTDEPDQVYITFVKERETDK